MGVIIGSARSDENYKITGGKAGDQRQTNKDDKSGEVSMQDFYIHKLGWYVVRPKAKALATKLAERMKTACNNPNIGYNQYDRYGIVKYGIDAKSKINTDCSSLIRECVKEASGKDPGDFNTSTELAALKATKLFNEPIAYTSKVVLEDGDILVTKTKGHTAIVVKGSVTTPVKTEPTKNTKDTKDSSQVKFIKDVQKALGAEVDGIAGPETLSKTITLSRTKNRTHAVVKVLQNRFVELGYMSKASEVFEYTFDSAVKRFQKANGCVADGEITAKQKTWKVILGIK